MSYIEDGNSNTEFVCSKEKNNIFLIGDSIRLGYCETIKQQLSDCASVFYINDNCRNTQYVISNIKRWAGLFDNTDLIDVVHFNCGHWDVAHWNGYEQSLTTEGEYAKNIEMIIKLIQKFFVNAKIIFATTTPMNPDGSIGNNPRYNSEIDRYNKIAVEIAEKNGIVVNDLNGFTRNWGSENYRDYCHYTPTAFENLGKEVAARLKKFI